MTTRCNPILSKGFLNVAQEGLENAARSLEILVDGKLTMDILWAGSVPTSRLCEVTGNPEDLVIGAYVEVGGDSRGHAVLMFPKDSALHLSDLALCKPIGSSTELGAMEESVVQEVANILTSSYLTAIADHYHITLWPEPPATAVDMAAAIIDNVILCSGQFESETLSIVTRFRGHDVVMDGVFLYIPELT